MAAAGSVTWYMETQRQVHLCICLLVGIPLIFLCGNGFCDDSSSFPSKEVTCDPNFVSDNSDSSSDCSFKKYLMKSYYEIHGSLNDSDFQEFIDQKLPFGFCEALPDKPKLLPRLSVLQRNLNGEGSHRHLSSSIRLNIKLESISELHPHKCQVILIERLPSGVYADPFELQHLLQRGVFNDIAVFGDTNLESPAFLSNRSAVEINMDVGPITVSNQNNEVDVKVKLPLHARYAPLSESGYWEVKFGAPDLFMRCTVEMKWDNRSCLYKIITNDDAELQNGTILWKIPSGIKAHAEVVYVFTFVSAFLSVLVIVLTSLFYSNTNSYKNLKQS